LERLDGNIMVDRKVVYEFVVVSDKTVYFFVEDNV